MAKKAGGADSLRDQFVQFKKEKEAAGKYGNAAAAAIRERAVREDRPKILRGVQPKKVSGGRPMQDLPKVKTVIGRKTK